MRSPAILSMCANPRPGPAMGHSPRGGSTFAVGSGLHTLGLYGRGVRVALAGKKQLRPWKCPWTPACQLWNQSAQRLTAGPCFCIGLGRTEPGALAVPAGRVLHRPARCSWVPIWPSVALAVTSSQNPWHRWAVTESRAREEKLSPVCSAPAGRMPG